MGETHKKTVLVDGDKIIRFFELEITFTGPLSLRRPNSTGLPPARAMPGFNLIADTRKGFDYRLLDLLN